MDLPTIAITEEMLEPLVQGVIANVSVEIGRASCRERVLIQV